MIPEGKLRAEAPEERVILSITSARSTLGWWLDMWKGKSGEGACDGWHGGHPWHDFLLGGWVNNEVDQLGAKSTSSKS